MKDTELAAIARPQIVHKDGFVHYIIPTEALKREAIVDKKSGETTGQKSKFTWSATGAQIEKGYSFDVVGEDGVVRKQAKLSIIDAAQDAEYMAGVKAAKIVKNFFTELRKLVGLNKGTKAAPVVVSEKDRVTADMLDRWYDTRDDADGAYKIKGKTWNDVVGNSTDQLNKYLAIRTQMYSAAEKEAASSAKASPAATARFLLERQRASLTPEELKAAEETVKAMEAKEALAKAKKAAKAAPAPVVEPEADDEEAELTEQGQD